VGPRAVLDAVVKRKIARGVPCSLTVNQLLKKFSASDRLLDPLSSASNLMDAEAWNSWKFTSTPKHAFVV
jgi:hypothetical protein